MVRRRGPRLTAAQKAEVWRRWRHGESLNAIGRALGRIAKVVRYEVARTGGVAPHARHRSRLALTLIEREAISRGLACGTSLRQISRQLRRAPSTISREIRRHGGRRWYRAAAADRRAWVRGRRPKRCRLATYPALRDAVATKLAQKWSPQQIAGWLRQASAGLGGRARASTGAPAPSRCASPRPAASPRLCGSPRHETARLRAPGECGPPGRRPGQRRSARGDDTVQETVSPAAAHTHWSGRGATRGRPAARHTPDGWRSTGRPSSRRPPPGQRAAGLQLVHLRVQ